MSTLPYWTDDRYIDIPPIVLAEKAFQPYPQRTVGNVRALAELFLNKESLLSWGWDNVWKPTSEFPITKRFLEVFDLVNVPIPDAVIAESRDNTNNHGLYCTLIYQNVLRKCAQDWREHEVGPETWKFLQLFVQPSKKEWHEL